MRHYLTVYKSSVCIPLLSSNGVTATDKATFAAVSIDIQARAKGVNITYLPGEKVSFTCIHKYIVKVPAKALKDLESFKAWNYERIDKYFKKDVIKQ